jgi:hypothetical protein
MNVRMLNKPTVGEGQGKEHLLEILDAVKAAHEKGTLRGIFLVGLEEMDEPPEGAPPGTGNTVGHCFAYNNEGMARMLLDGVSIAAEEMLMPRVIEELAEAPHPEQQPDALRSDEAPSDASGTPPVIPRSH